MEIQKRITNSDTSQINFRFSGALCIKRVGLKTLPGCRNSTRAVLLPLNRFAVHYLVRLNFPLVMVKSFVTGNSASIRLFLELRDGAGSELADRVDHVRDNSAPLCTFGCRYKGHPEAAVIEADALH